MIVQSATEPGDPNSPNEDWVYASEDLLIVIDGATARTKTGCIHGVAWYAEQLGKALVIEASFRENSLQKALAEAIAQVASLHADCDLAHPATPSAAVGVVRIGEGETEILVLADITIAVQTTDSKVRTITDSRVSDSAPIERSEALSLSIDDPHRLEALQRMKLAQQEKRNRLGGFYVAAADPAIAYESHTESVALDYTGAVAILSDGAARAANIFGVSTWTHLMSLLEQSGPGAIIESVRRLESGDQSAQRWPRSKSSDDATVAYLRRCGPS